MNRREISFLVMYSIIVLLHVGNRVYDVIPWMEWVLKSSIMLSLVVYFAYKTLIRSRFDLLCIAAFTFAFYGDILLIRTAAGNHFVLGLLSFALCHLLYSFVFLARERSVSVVLASLKKRFLLIAIGLIAVVGALWFIYPAAPESLQTYILGYGIIIFIMYSAAALSSFKETSAYWNGVIGAGLFLFSDCLLAFDKFVEPVPLREIGVMGSYAAAQFLIARAFIAKSFEVALHQKKLVYNI